MCIRQSLTLFRKNRISDENRSNPNQTRVAIFFQKLCDLACKSPILDICNAKRLPGTPEVDASKIFPMMWRFFPTLDPQVYFTGFLHLIRIHCRICNQWMLILITDALQLPNLCGLDKRNKKMTWVMSWSLIRSIWMVLTVRSEIHPESWCLYSQMTWLPWHYLYCENKNWTQNICCHDMWLMKFCHFQIRFTNWN